MLDTNKKSYHKRLLKIALLILCFIPSCTPYFPVEVNSINSDSAIVKKTYALMPANEGVNENNLSFQEYATYIHRVLKEKGFNQAEPESAELLIFVSYGIGRPQQQHYSYSAPIYDSQTFGGTVTGSGQLYSFQGMSHGITGFQTYSGSHTVYLQYLILDAYDAEKLRESNGENMVQVWKTTVVGKGSSNDLRRLLPVLAGAAYEYIGTDTKRKVNFVLTENDEKVQLAKGQ